MADTRSLRLLALAVAAVLLIAGGYSFLAVAGKDDVCFAFGHGKPLSIANEMYLTWSGRWLGILALSVAAKSVNLFSWQYGALVALSFPIWLTGFYAIAAASMERHRLVAALLMLAVFWTASPATTEAFYWLTGAIIYAPAFLLGSVSILLVVRKSKWAIIPALAAPLFNELAGIALIAGLLPFFRRREALLALAAAAVGTLVVVLSPGNAARAAEAVHVSPLRLAFYVVRPYDSPWTLMADARLLAMITFLAALPKEERQIPWRVMLAVLFAILVSTVAATFGQNMTLQGRVLDFLFAITVGAAFALGLSLKWNAPAAVLAGILALTLVASPSIKSVFHDPLPAYQRTPCPYSIDR